MTNSNDSIKPQNELIARFILAHSIADATAYASEHAANRFDRSSDDDFDYLPAALAIASHLSQMIEPILISNPDSTECIDFIASLVNDHEFILNDQTYGTLLSYYLPLDEDDDEIDAMMNQMIRDDIDDELADFAPDINLRELPEGIESSIERRIMNIRNAFTNAHREVYPNSYSSSPDAYPSTIIIDPNPYKK